MYHGGVVARQCYRRLEIPMGVLAYIFVYSGRYLTICIETVYN